MLPKSERERIIALMNREVVPAIGCTEPIAVALCTARATEELGRCPEHIDVRLSANILKNAMGVGIPGTGGMIGLPIAVALGALVGKSEYQLEVLRDVTPEDLQGHCSCGSCGGDCESGCEGGCGDEHHDEGCGCGHCH